MIYTIINKKIMFYVYEIKNKEGKVEYVGQTKNLKERARTHFKKKPLQPGMGAFYGREDCSLYPVKEFTNKREALNYEEELTRIYGLKTGGDKLGDIFIGKKTKENGLPVNVYFYKLKKKPYRVKITINKKSKWIGSFNTPEEAVEAYQKEYQKTISPHL